MTVLPQTIRYTREPQRAVAAWLLAGGDAAEWLRVIAASPVKQRDVRLLVLPTNATDRRPAAALITLTGQAHGWIEGGLPYGCASGRLYLPIEARLVPCITDDELAALLFDRLQYVWSPVSGLVAYEPHEVLSIGDLVAAPSTTNVSWSFAVPGLMLAPRLLSIEPSQPPTLESFLLESQGDIGSQTNDLDQLPPSSSESSKSPLSAATQYGVQMLAKAVQWLAQRAPGGAATETWIDAVEQWADAKLASAAAATLANRIQELHRLLELLDTNPEEGLKYALPMGGDAHRGLAPPSDRLARREVDFRLGSLGGGGPVDFWDVPDDTQHRLSARYRELASREMRLGRYRRAAYIFAQLLGDLHAAASALKSGHHWREAAVLYRDRLQRRLEAAQCLEQGGLWTEAISLYEEMQHFEKAGDLHQQLGQPEAAHEYYRREADKLMSEGDLVASARVLEVKLEDVDAATDRLAGGWPNSRQARKCLHSLFQLYGKYGRHEEAGRKLERFRKPCEPAPKQTDLVEIVSDVANHFPDRRVRQQAADLTRVIAAAQLPGAGESEASRLVSAVSRLAPHDRLLGRDGQRYLRDVRDRARAPVAPQVAAGEIEEISRVRIAHCVEIRAATWIDDTLYLVGQDTDRGLRLWRHRWMNEPADDVAGGWKLASNWNREAPINLAADSLNDNRLLVHVIDQRTPEIRCIVLTATDNFPTQMICGSASGICKRTLGAARTGGGFTWLIKAGEDGNLALNGYSPTGVIANSRNVVLRHGPVPSGSLRLPIPVHASERHVYLAIGDELQIYRGDENPDRVSLPDVAIGITGSLRHTRGRVAVALERGAQLFWTGFGRDDGHFFAQGMRQPVVGFATGGFLVAADDSRIQVCTTANRELHVHSHRGHDDSAPVAVLASPCRPDEFAIVLEDGSLVFWRVV